jgi:[FeFe] hydrogenase (group B1/B3)
MAKETNTTRIRRELMVHVARGVLDGTLEETVDRLPVELRPRNPRRDPLRCCVHTERAILRYRLMALLGFGAEDETDEIKPLAAYTREARARRKRDSRLLTVIEEACSACLKGKHFVSDACRGCMARPCLLNCPKGAIRLKGGRARIDNALCVDCGKCRDLCAFKAIVKISVPCEEACPTEAITRSESGKQCIDPDLCTACGKCMTTCPFGAIAELSELVEVLGALAAGEPMVALFAPALVGQFDGTPAQVVGALRRLGFRGVVEVAAGADQVAHAETEELLERLEAGDPYMTSSCCPAFTGLVGTRFPAMVPRVSTPPTPLHCAAQLATVQFPGARRVFISPCAAKRKEAQQGAGVDHVLTMEELGAALVGAGIEVGRCEDGAADIGGSGRGTAFAASGGVRDAVLALLPEGTTVTTELLSGLGKENQRILRNYASGKGAAQFLEGMSCEGGCVAGPCTLADPRLARKRMEAAVRTAKA